MERGTGNREEAWTDERLSETAHGYWESLALMSAVHLGLFDALADGPLADADLALKLGASLRGTSMLAKPWLPWASSGEAQTASPRSRSFPAAA